jgi:hypothetical protein
MSVKVISGIGESGIALFFYQKRVSDLKRQREIISFGGHGIMKEVRSRRKRNYEEPDACHLDKLTYEQVKRVPVKGDVFILNLRCEGGPTGLYREVTEIRGCYRVVDDSHPRFIICDEFRNERLTGRRMLLRSDFYAGIAKVKLVDRIYYKSGKDGLTWEQLAVENF